MITVPPATAQIYTHQLHEKHDHRPGAAARIDKAAAILHAGDIHADNNQFFVLSSQNDGTGYHIGPSCECPDAKAPQIDGYSYCKHRFAVAMLKRYIAEQISPRILEGTDNAPNRNIIKWQKNGTKTPTCHLVRHGQNGDCLTDGQHFGIRITYSSKLKCWTPRTEADYLKAADWLEHVAQPIPYHQRKWATSDGRRSRHPIR